MNHKEFRERAQDWRQVLERLRDRAAKRLVDLLTFGGGEQEQIEQAAQELAVRSQAIKSHEEMVHNAFNKWHDE